MDVKTCVKCGVEKPANREHFHSKGSANGKQYYHKECKGCRDQSNSSDDVKLVEEFKTFGEKLLAFADGAQQLQIERVLELGSLAETSRVLDIPIRELRANLHDLKRKAASRGFSPSNDMTKPTPEGFHVKGVSTYYDADGNVRGQWVKTKKEEDHKITELLDAMSHLADSFQAVADPVEVASYHDRDLLCVYPMGDPHLGMYAWQKETGQSFDLRIAERNLVCAVDHLVGLAPPAHEALIINLGDFFHADNSSNQTLRGHHALDVDTRWGKVLAVGIRTMRRCIDQALLKHARVRVICEIGNHDDHSAIMLSLCLAQYYEREPRVSVDTSPDAFHWHTFGKNLIGVHHGHSTKKQDLPGVMATDQRKAWGEAEHCYWYTGHVHHDSLREYSGVTVESFRTLAPKDSWHNASGYRSGQDMKCDVLHREYGKINRHVVGIRQIWRMVDDSQREENE